MEEGRGRKERMEERKERRGGERRTRKGKKDGDGESCRTNCVKKAQGHTIVILLHFDLHDSKLNVKIVLNEHCPLIM